MKASQARNRKTLTSSCNAIVNRLRVLGSARVNGPQRWPFEPPCPAEDLGPCSALVGGFGFSLGLRGLGFGLGFSLGFSLGLRV